MPERTYKLIELVGSSEVSTEEAIRNAISRAAQSVKGLDWFEVAEVRGLLEFGGRKSLRWRSDWKRTSKRLRPSGWRRPNRRRLQYSPI